MRRTEQMSRDVPLNNTQTHTHTNTHTQTQTQTHTHTHHRSNTDLKASESASCSRYFIEPRHVIAGRSLTPALCVLLYINSACGSRPTRRRLASQVKPKKRARKQERARVRSRLGASSDNCERARGRRHASEREGGMRASEKEEARVPRTHFV